MHRLEQALDRHATVLTRRLTEQVGFTREEAARFLELAGPALLDSYEWQADRMPTSDLATPAAARELLAGIGGRRIADRLGLSPELIWAGLRAFVPAVLDASAETGPRRFGGRDPEQGPSRRHEGSDGPQRFEIGFGLDFEAEPRQGRDGAGGGGGASGPRYPIFDRHPTGWD